MEKLNSEKNNSDQVLVENPKIIMLVGLPASGKSSLAKDLSDTYNAIIHASDEIRKELNITEQTKQSNQKVFEVLHERIKNDLRNGKNVIYDATNISYKKRKEFLRGIKNISCKKSCYFLASPYEKCLEQNRERKEKVPEEVIKKMYKNFDIPAYFEGWDEIKIIWNLGGYKEKYDITLVLNEMFGFNQHNSYHRFRLGFHSEKVAKNLNALSTELYFAGLLHDCGKIETASFTNWKGEETKECHYYNHEHVSAYKALFCLKNLNADDNFIFNVCQLIRWHMQPYFNKVSNREKADKKYRKMFGEKFWNDLMLLHEADIEAH